MKRARNCIAVTAVVAIIVMAADITLATTCVSQKPFTVRQICGIVVDPSGHPIPSAQIEVGKGKSVPGWRAVADENGRFALAGVPSGTYELHVHVQYFVDARQTIAIKKPMNSERCDTSLRIHMELANSCTWVSVEKTK